MRFETFGPVEIPRPNRLIAQNPNGFWEVVEELCEGLSAACGCYLFAAKSSGGPTPYPWYVGQTNKRSFRTECFDHQKLTHYQIALVDYKRVTPVLFLMARRTNGGAFSKPSKNGYPDIDKLEEMLIGMAFIRNRKLRNVQGTAHLRDLVLPGVINSPMGNPGKPAIMLKGTLGL